MMDFILWSSFFMHIYYIFTKILYAMDYKIACRIVSSVHAIIVFSYVFYTLFFLPQISKDISNTIFIISTCYLLSDLFTQNLYDKFDLANTFHHLGMIYLLYIGNSYESLEKTMYIGLLCEITNPLINFSYYLNSHKLNNTALYKYNLMILIGLFFIFRVLNFTYLFLTRFFMLYFPVREIFLVILVLNYYWFSWLVQKGRKDLSAFFKAVPTLPKSVE